MNIIDKPDKRMYMENGQNGGREVRVWVTIKEHNRYLPMQWTCTMYIVQMYTDLHIIIPSHVPPVRT